MAGARAWMVLAAVAGVVAGDGAAAAAAADGHRKRDLGGGC